MTKNPYIVRWECIDWNKIWETLKSCTRSNYFEEQLVKQLSSQKMESSTQVQTLCVSLHAKAQSSYNLPSAIGK